MGFFVANVLDCDIIVSEFERQSRYYIDFRTNTIEKGINPFIDPCYGLKSSTVVLLQL